MIFLYSYLFLICAGKFSSSCRHLYITLGSRDHVQYKFVGMHMMTNTNSLSPIWAPKGGTYDRTTY